MKELHIVPLARQAIAVLRELEKESGNRPHIFPNEHKPAAVMSENTMLTATMWGAAGVSELFAGIAHDVNEEGVVKERITGVSLRRVVSEEEQRRGD